MKMQFCYYDTLDKTEEGNNRLRVVDLGECPTVKRASMKVVRLISEAREGFQPYIYPDETGACNVVGSINSENGIRLALLRIDSEHRYRWCRYYD